MDVTIEMLERTTRLAGETVHNLSPEDLGRQTPCKEWDIRALLKHLVGGNMLTAARISRRELPGSDNDFLGDDPIGAYDASVTAVTSAFQREGALDETYEHPVFGNPAGSDLLRIRILEHLAHGWDLAVATNQPRDREPELYEEVLEFARPLVASRPPAAASSFDPPQEAPPDACPADVYAALLGRRIPT